MRFTGYGLGRIPVFIVALSGVLAAPVVAETTAAPTTQPSNGLVPTTLLQVGKGVEPTIRSLFGPRTERQYFSPFEIMNPSHIRPELPMEIGEYRDLQVFMGFQSVGRFQALQQENVFIKGVHQPGLNPGLQD